MKTTKLRLETCVFFILLVVGLAPNVNAQVSSSVEEEELREDAINIFIDDAGLDMNYVREQIPYGNFVRDTRDADVYVLETRQSNGSGGSTYTYIFEGQGEFINMHDTLTLATSPDDTFDQTRESRTNMLKLGLVRFVAQTPLYSQLQVSSVGGSQRPEVEAVDKWNNWVFELRTSPRYSSEDRRKSFSMNNSVQATKITPDIKVEMDVRQNNSTTKNITGRGDTIKSTRNSFFIRNLIVFSLNEHWSVGGRANFTRSTYSNYDSRYEFAPAIEFNIFPYSESTHRQLRMMYSVGFAINNYTDTTVYLKTDEKLVEQQLDIAFRVQERWGFANFSIEASNYMHDFKKNRFEVGGSINYRITRGLSINASASYAWIKNQLSLPKGDATVEEILLGLVQLPTTSQFESSVGLSYTFGSIYNNVVNPRFGGGGGGGGGRF